MLGFRPGYIVQIALLLFLLDNHLDVELSLPEPLFIFIF